MSLTARQAETLVQTTFKTAWDVAHSGMFIARENAVKPEPESEVDYWVRVTLRPRDRVQHTLNVPGRRQWRQQSNVWVQLYGPIGVGSGALSDLVTEVRNVFEGTAFGGIDPEGACRDEKIGPDGRWYEVVVICPVVYYEIR